MIKRKPDRQAMTAKEQALYDFIRRWLGDRHYPPTYEEMRQGVHWSSKSLVDYHLTGLENKGYLTRTRATARAVMLTQNADEIARLIAARGHVDG